MMADGVENRRDPFEEAALLGLGSWPPGTVLLAAVSGGADSTAMLAALAPTVRERGLRLHCLHVEHGIRPAEESRGDALAVRRFCVTLDIPCRIVSIPRGRIVATAKERGLGIEAAARLYRHAAWNREAARIGAARILVAHTQDDLLETALMRVLRGAGPAGLAAMPASSGLILRPLLGIRRVQVLRYLADRGIPFRTDSTNADPAYLRNRIRRRLLPLLNESFPHWRSGVLSMARTQSLAAAFIAGEAAQRVRWERAEEWSIPRERFFDQEEIIREEALFQALDAIPPACGSSKNPDFQAEASGKPLRRASIRRFSRGECRVLELGGAIRLEDRNGRVIISRRSAGPEEEGFSLLIKEPGHYKLKELEIELAAGGMGTGFSEAGFYGRLPLALRKASAEDRIKLAGRRFSKPETLDRACLSGYAGVICAEDTQGVAALIGVRREGAAVLARREEPGRTGGHGLFFFMLR